VDPTAIVSLVKARRRKLGWSQTELAAAMGSSPSRVNKLESNDRSVAVSLMLRALDVMAAPLRIEVDVDRDPLADPSLTPKQRRAVSMLILRRAQAQMIAAKYSVDAGDVEHVLSNLSLSPAQRLADSFRRAKLKKSAVLRR
jgi:transcriptional regulator with XRE-family HTH domain